LKPPNIALNSLRLRSILQDFASLFYHRVFTPLHVLARHIHLDVRVDAELQLVHVRIVHGAGRETDGPAVRNFRAEREARTSSGLVAHDGDQGKLAHTVHEIVRGAERAAIGQHHRLLLPPDARRRLQVDRSRVGEIVVSGAGLVRHVAHQHLFVRETAGQPLGRSKVSASVVAHVDDQSVADGQPVQGLVQVPVADAVGEAGAIDVADVVFQYLVRQTGRDGIIFSQVIALDAVAEVVRVAVEPFPVLRGGHRAAQVHVTVTKLVHHVREDLEQGLRRHVRSDAFGVPFVHLVPVQAVHLLLVVQETVLLVDDAPQRFEVGFRAVAGHLFADAGNAAQAAHQDKKKEFQSFHKALEWSLFFGHTDLSFLPEQVQVPHESDEEIVRIQVAFQMIDLRLADVAQVADAQDGARDRKVQRHQLLE